MALRCFQKDEILNCDGYTSLPITNENSRISGSSLGSYLEVVIEANRKGY